MEYHRKPLAMEPICVLYSTLHHKNDAQFTSVAAKYVHKKYRKSEATIFNI